MELKDFISSTIEEISRGILAAKDQLKDTNAVVSPHNFQVNSKESQAFGRTKNEDAHEPQKWQGTRVVQKVDFDIAVTVSDADKSNAAAKISVLSIGIGGAVENVSSTGTNSRIQFSVPVVFPSNET